MPLLGIAYKGVKIMPKLEIKNVSLRYHTIEGEIEALKDFNLTVEKQEFISIVDQVVRQVYPAVSSCRIDSTHVW